MALYGIKDCANLQLFDLATGKPVLFSDYANVSTNEWTSERVYANSKGTRAIAWDYDKQGTLAVEMEVFDLKWLSILAGSDMIEGEVEVAKREVGKSATGSFTLTTGTPVPNSVQVVKVGADEIEHIGEPLEEVPYSATPATPLTANQFMVNGNEIILATDTVDGTAFAVYFVALDTQAKKISISADKFPKAFKVIADALIREKESGKDEFVQIEYPNARPQGNFTVTMSATEPTNLQVTFDLFPNKDKEMAVYKVIGE